ncbi:DegQ family serine endoprotease [Aureimonas sp. AU4]|uniref:DegQ family serine endoprotease n=1 Tax=Aureimonas sp. AU4 TaxID=1638163 RepID=UPI0007825CBB|nr:DegQ family serine endoprotease [Aureimonas sp. AU4]
MTRLSTILATSASLLLVGSAEPVTAQDAAPPVASQPITPQDRVPASQSEIKLSFAPLVKASAPAVVNVYAARVVANRSPFAGDPFFEQFFGRRQSRPRMESSLGSGVLVDKSGVLVTNNHVIENADEIRVALADGREFAAKLLLKDARADLAVLKIEGDEPFPVVPIADSDAAEIGDLVLAIGNPFGIGQTVTNGIVSALARTHVGVNDFGYFIQTDAAINPGNSGGALIDMRGQLVGINTAIFSRSGGSNGIGFAIPSNMVRAFVEAAERGTRFERPYVGAVLTPVTPDIAEALGLPRPAGALVQTVRSGGPAEEAGLREGDVVLAMNGFPIDNPDTLGYRLATAGIGRDAELRVEGRNGEETLRLALEPAPETPRRDERRIEGETPFSGASVANLSPRLAEELEMADTREGVVVTEVEPGTPAARLGFQPKDIVLSLNGRDIRSSADLEQRAEDGRRGWEIEVERNGKTLTQRVR